MFIDADKENYVPYLEWAIKLARPGAIIVADNVIRQGKVLAGQDAAATCGAADAQADGEHPRLDAAAIQTVGSKRWDGFAFATVK